MKKHYHFRLFAVGFSVLFSLFFSTFQANAQGTFRVRFILDGITRDNADLIRGMHIYYSDDERIMSYEDPDRRNSLTSLPSNIPYFDASFYSYSSDSYAARVPSYYNRTSNKLYYRYYSPCFTDVQTGCVELDENVEENIVYLHPLQNKKAIKVTVPKDRDGKYIKEYTFFTNVAKANNGGNSGTYDFTNGIHCYNNIDEDDEDVEIDYYSFYIYAEKGTTLHYAIDPFQNTDCALAVRTLEVTNDDTPQTIDTDYSKAQLLRLFVADGKGKYIKMENPRLQNTFYDNQCSSYYGWGAFTNRPLNFDLKESADGSYNWIETYALPGSEQNFEIYGISIFTTTDPDFIFPYNCPSTYLVKEIDVTDDATPQDVVMGKSDPRDVAFRVKGAAQLSNVLYPNVEAYYDFKYYPVKDDQKWGSAHYKEVSHTTDGDDLIFHLKVNAAAPHVRISPKVRSFLEYRDTLWKANIVINNETFDLPKEGTYTNQTVMDFSKVHAVNFIARNGFLNNNKVALHADCFESDESFTHYFKTPLWNSEAIDTITVYLSEGNYEWYTISSETGISASEMHAFHVDSSTNQSIIVDDVLSSISSAKNANEEAHPECIFTLEGKRISAPQHGINLIRMTDGTVKKVKK